MTAPAPRPPRTASPAGYVVRVTLSAARRRQLSNMAREAGVADHELASRLLSDLIDDDAAAHGARA